MSEVDLEAEVARLRRWKAEASPLFDGMQDLGRALGVPLGALITGPEAVKAAEALAERVRAAEAKIERVDAALAYTSERGVSCGGLSVDADGCFAGDLAARIRAALGDEARP